MNDDSEVDFGVQWSSSQIFHLTPTTDQMRPGGKTKGNKAHVKWKHLHLVIYNWMSQVYNFVHSIPNRDKPKDMRHIDTLTLDRHLGTTWKLQESLGKSNRHCSNKPFINSWKKITTVRRVCGIRSLCENMKPN